MSEQTQSAIGSLALAMALVMGSAMLPAGTASAAAPAALVMAVEGKTTPPLEVYQELPPDTRITLAKGTRVALLHYVSCAVSTIRNGNVTVTATTIESAAGQVESVKPGPCARQHRVTVAGQGTASGVIISRAIPPARSPLQVGASDTIVLTGPYAPRAISAEVVDAAGAVVAGALPTRGASVRLPGNKVLTPGSAYVLRIRIEGVADPVGVPLAIATAPVEGQPLLRLE